jgi:hypothetical protein
MRPIWNEPARLPDARTDLGLSSPARDALQRAHSILEVYLGDVEPADLSGRVFLI